jgi:lactam utilization protein B
MKSNTLFENVRRVLMQHWDPIGVNDVPAAQDEYDEYVEEMIEMLRRDASVSALEQRLLDIETLSMGLRGDRAKALRTAEVLRAI